MSTTKFTLSIRSTLLPLAVIAMIAAGCSSQNLPTLTTTVPAATPTATAPSTSTAVATATALPPTSTPPPPTVTSAPPTSTPAATASAGEVRIQFAAGATSGIVEGHLQPGQTQDFLVAAVANQPLIVMTGSLNNDVTFSVTGVKDGNILLNASEKLSSWQTMLTVTQDYLIRVISGATAENFTLNVITPARITFKPGAVSDVETGSTPGGLIVSYILRASADQQMDIQLDVPGDSALLSVYGFDNGQPYLRSAAGVQSFSMKLPATQDYIIQVVPNAGRVTDYTLDISIK